VSHLEVLLGLLVLMVLLVLLVLMGLLVLLVLLVRQREPVPVREPALPEQTWKT